VAVVLFDGVCNLCNGIVRFVIARDPHAHFRFAPLTSTAAARLLKGVAAPEPGPDSVILVDEGRIFTRSDAALRIARSLTFPWPLAFGLVVLPRSWRDAVYDLIASRRYRWFGKRDTCMVPDPALRARFIEEP